MTLRHEKDITHHTRGGHSFVFIVLMFVCWSQFAFIDESLNQSQILTENNGSNQNQNETRQDGDPPKRD
jgi:hypothetical protein